MEMGRWVPILLLVFKLYYVGELAGNFNEDRFVLNF